MPETVTPVLVADTGETLDQFFSGAVQSNIQIIERDVAGGAVVDRYELSRAGIILECGGLWRSTKVPTEPPSASAVSVTRS